MKEINDMVRKYCDLMIKKFDIIKCIKIKVELKNGKPIKYKKCYEK